MEREGKAPIKGRVVDLIEGVDLATRVFHRGTRGLGDTCRLTLSLNGDERLHFEEEAGDRAPAELVIDVRMPEEEGERVLSALSVRPWAHPEQPVIIFPIEGADERAVGYMVRGQAMDRLLATIAVELDLPDVAVETPQSALDATSRGG